MTAQRSLFAPDVGLVSTAKPARRVKQCSSVHTIATGQRYRCCLPEGHESPHTNGHGPCLVSTWDGVEENDTVADQL